VYVSVWNQGTVMKRRMTFSKRHLLGVLLALSAVASFAGGRVARPLRQMARFLLAPLGHAPMYLVTELSAKDPDGEGEGISAADARKLRRENDYLRRLVSYWRNERELYRRQARQLANFQRLYGPTDDLACELIPARVVAAGSLPYDRTRVLKPRTNRAVRSGSPVTARQLLTDRSKVLPPRLAVVNDSSLVGRITDSGAFTARLQLLTDRAFRVRGRIRRIVSPNRPRMITVTEGTLPRTTTLTPANNEPIDVIARGDGASRLTVEHVKEYHNVRPGDLLVTSAHEENLPVEIHIGKVVRVQRDPKDPHRVRLTVEPHADLDGLRDVFILSPVSPSATDGEGP